VKRILLTGSTGFIGRHCLPLLVAHGYEVHAVSSKARGEKSPDVYWHQADLLDECQAAALINKVQPSHLLHLAWYAVPKNYWNSSENLRWVRASLSLLQEFAKHNGERVVMAGTCAEYDWSYGYCSETLTPLAPSTLYGVCKHSLQSILDAFSKQTELSAAWGRIFFLYGPHENPDRLISSVIRNLLHGLPAPCSHGNQVRDFLYVVDAASAFVALLQSNIQGAVNIGSGVPISLKNIIYKIGEKIGRSDLIRLGEIASSLNDPPFLVANIQRLKVQVGWNARYSLDMGLDQTIQWGKDNLSLIVNDRR